MRESCKDWLSKKLANNAIFLCDDVKQDAKKSGYTKSELKEARKELNVKTFHQFDEDGSTPNWFWHQ